MVNYFSCTLMALLNRYRQLVKFEIATDTYPYASGVGFKYRRCNFFSCSKMKNEMMKDPFIFSLGTTETNRKHFNRDTR